MIKKREQTLHSQDLKGLNKGAPRRKTRPRTEKMEEGKAYTILFFFFGSFLLRFIFGSLTTSKALFVSSMFALFGVFICVVSIIRVSAKSGILKNSKLDFNHEKIEFIVVAGISLIISLTTGVLLFSIAHIVLFHTLFPPSLFAAWMGAFLAIADLFILKWINNRMLIFKETDIKRILFIIINDLWVCVFIIITVVLSRSGMPLFDYVLGFVEAIFIISYSVYFLHYSVKGLMDASYDRASVSDIKGYIKRGAPALRIKKLKVNPKGRALEIIVIFYLDGVTKVNNARRVIERVKMSLEKSLQKPHELYVGFVGSNNDDLSDQASSESLESLEST